MVEYVKRWSVTPPAYRKNDFWLDRRKRLHVEIMGVEGDGVFQECNSCHHSMTKHKKTTLAGGYTDQRTGVFRHSYKAYCVMEKEVGYPYDLCACAKIFVEVRCVIVGVEL